MVRERLHLGIDPLQRFDDKADLRLDHRHSGDEELSDFSSTVIVAQLEQLLEGLFLDLSGEDFVALIKCFEAGVEASNALLYDMRDNLPGIDAVMVERGVTRSEAIHFIVSDWLREHRDQTPERD